MKIIFSAILGLLFLCAPMSAYSVELSVRNDLAEDDDGKILEIENALSKEAPKNAIRFKILPGEEKRLTGGNVTYFILSRVFARHKLKYEIRCDREKAGSDVLTLLKVHQENLPDGCKIERRGHWSKRSGMNWDQTSPAQENISRGSLARP